MQTQLHITNAELADSLKRYTRHAELFGVECVGSTAAAEWMALLRARRPSPVDLTWMTVEERERVLDERQAFYADFRKVARRLQIDLDGIEANRKRGRFTVGKRRRRSRAESAVAAQLLAEDGLARVEIAEKLGVTVKTIDNLLSPGAVRTTDHLRRAVRGMETPANQGVKSGGVGRQAFRAEAAA